MQSAIVGTILQHILSSSAATSTVATSVMAAPSAKDLRALPRLAQQGPGRYGRRFSVPCWNLDSRRVFGPPALRLPEAIGSGEENGAQYLRPLREDSSQPRQAAPRTQEA